MAEIPWRIEVEEQRGFDGHRFLDLTDEPFPTVAQSRPVRVRFTPSDKVPLMTDSDKPPYRVPPMGEIAETRGTNGLTVVSTFSGCGGSCLGFEMAGYKVLWASEFVDAAREVYGLNHPGVPVDSRDIREITPGDILKATGLAAGQVDVLEGSPPCASFSMSGKREKSWGKVSTYSETEQRSDDLFFEFARILDGLQPRVFVAENVAGLVRGTAKGYFKMILRRLRQPGYRVAAKMLDAQWLGVPQRRKRLFFVGVREDLDVEPAFPCPLQYRYTIADALPWITSYKTDYHGRYTNLEAGPDEPVPTVTVADVQHHEVYGPVPTDEDLAAVSIEQYAIHDDWKRVRSGKDARYINTALAETDEPSPTVTQAGGTLGAASVMLAHEPRKFTIGELRRICGFPDDFALTGTYGQQWERLGRAVPPPMMRAVAETIRDHILQPAEEE